MSLGTMTILPPERPVFSDCKALYFIGNQNVVDEKSVFRMIAADLLSPTQIEKDAWKCNNEKLIDMCERKDYLK